ncbi:helix-turn-helix transcriptional regulator [Actinomadura roseirufa]|uniref:helix-turn-helix transcriptional regulator n=1 Tax=Actinomadura roseirufa TaxID=2094049 RepID=UPI001040F0AE|nr:helix-turn-helix transcriptional regulator [Actinomadura roseirufa]
MAGDDLPELAHFLRTRRARLSPERAGLDPAGVRRLPGLRRSEVAALAGISPEYYTRLEQGRQRRPSRDVVDALAAALRLDQDEHRHLRRLAERPSRPAPSSGTPAVSETTRRLLRSVKPWPAYVVSPLRDVLAWNDAAAWLLTDFSELPAGRCNLAWFAFCDPRAQDLYVDWEGVAAGNAHRLRDALAADPYSERGAELVAALTAESPAFAERWERHDVRGPNTGRKELTHPEAGPLTLDYANYLQPGADHLELVVMTAPEGSASYRALIRRFSVGAALAPEARSA